MCMCGLAFHWQHFGSPAEFMLQTKASFPPLNCEVQQFIFTGAWWLVNGGEDSGWAMIHGLSRAHLGVSFSAPYHYKSFYIITLGNGKMLCCNVAEENVDYRSYFPATKMKSALCERLHWMPPPPHSFLRYGCVFGLFAAPLLLCTFSCGTVAF